MHPDMIWGNDEKYTKEYQIKCREEQQKKYNELMERLAKEKEESEKEEQIKQIARQAELEQKWANGEIQDEFIKRHMKGQITAARWALALGMAVTFLLKGQWLIWIVMIFVYVIYVNNVKTKALEADKKKFKRQ